MAVITRYIVERNGEEKMTFVSKKDADAYDKELDIADNLQGMLKESELEIDDSVIEEISLYLARNRDAVSTLLKGSKPKNNAAESKQKSDSSAKSSTDKKSDDAAVDPADTKVVDNTVVDIEAA